ncbi:response regulator [Aquincola tertiaricarbonis]|uniref:response regulator n=1 Tax=Aquincola tertiaricarbonis TaxID=391953 RepID=UPI00202368AD|nr:response regulator transcription factor [Aquincola tertiaricarbonis]
MEAGRIISIVVAEDHALVRQGLQLVLSREARIRWLGEAGDGPTALALTRSLQPDVLLLDLGLPGLDGLDVMQAITTEQLSTRVVVVTARQDAASVRASLSYGAHAYVLKTDDADELIGAIFSVAAGGYYVSVELASVFERESTADREPLSSRELDIAARVGRGMASKAIGRELGISEHTVRKHRENIARKLGLRNAAELVAWSIRHRL